MWSDSYKLLFVRPNPIRTSVKGVILLLASLVVACGDGNSNDDGADPADEVTTCEHEYRDSALNIVTASSRGPSGAAIAYLYLSDIKMQGQDVPVEKIGKTENITVVGDELQCEVPCGFGQATGLYEFTVSALGYQEERYSAYADFAEYEYHCPSYSDKGTEIDVTLMGP